MEIEVRAPGFPESVQDGNVIAWHKHPGETVKKNDVLVDIETDKVMFEVPAVSDGILKKIEANEGATVTSQQILAIIDDQPAADNKKGKPLASPPPDVPLSATQRGEPARRAPAIAPAARKLIAEHELDSDLISGSGKGGRILKEDVMAYLEEAVALKPETGGEEKNLEPPYSELGGTTPGDDSFQITMPDDSRDKRVPMTRLRARIAERLLMAQHTAAILTTFNEVNMQPVIDLRQRYRDRFEKSHGVKLGFMSFFVKASVEALKRFPVVNASIDGSDIVYHNYFDVGIAVSSPRGLVVPVLRDAQQMSLAEVETQINEFSNKARQGSLTLEEISGGTFTITNGGVFGSMLSTPIINPPQSAILGMHKIEQRAVVENGNIVARPVMYLALSYDHRIIDGQEAVQYLVTIKELLEDPARILLEI
jgi:2-oxoglutarate dehydrogenase E2 component (dihydrolipoamide succinyltransferase)